MILGDRCVGSRKGSDERSRLWCWPGVSSGIELGVKAILLLLVKDAAWLVKRTGVQFEVQVSDRRSDANPLGCLSGVSSCSGRC